MAAATVAANTTLPQRSGFPLLTLSAIPIVITSSATAYATATGGLPFDLFTILANSSPFSASINYRDILGFIPVQMSGSTSANFLPTGFAIGTATSSTLPCTIRLIATGASSAAALGEIADGNITCTITGLLLVARGGQN